MSCQISSNRWRLISEAVKWSWDALSKNILSESEWNPLWAGQRSHVDPLTSVSQIWVTAAVSQRWIRLTAARLSAGRSSNTLLFTFCLHCLFLRNRSNIFQLVSCCLKTPDCSIKHKEIPSVLLFFTASYKQTRRACTLKGAGENSAN